MKKMKRRIELSKKEKVAKTKIRGKKLRKGKGISGSWKKYVEKEKDNEEGTSYCNI